VFNLHVCLGHIWFPLYWLCSAVTYTWSR
jgi:hypothetical protein